MEVRSGEKWMENFLWTDLYFESREELLKDLSGEKNSFRFFFGG